MERRACLPSRANGYGRSRGTWGACPANGRGSGPREEADRAHFVRQSAVARAYSADGRLSGSPSGGSLRRSWCRSVRADV